VYVKQVPHRALSGARPSEDLQGGGVFSVVVGLYDDVHVLIESDEEAQKALHGKLAGVAAQHLGDIGLGIPNRAAARLGSLFYARNCNLYHG